MNPFLVSTLATGLGKAAFGLHQKEQAAQLSNANYIPGALLANKTIAENNANRTMYAGQTQDQEAINRNIANNVANTTRNAKSGTDILNSNAMAQVRGDNASQEISKRLQQWKTKGLSDLANVNGQIGGVQEQNYGNYLATKAKLQNASNTNIFGGASEALAGGAALASGNKGGMGMGGGFNPWMMGAGQRGWGGGGGWSNYGGFGFDS